MTKQANNKMFKSRTAMGATGANKQRGFAIIALCFCLIT